MNSQAVFLSRLEFSVLLMVGEIEEIGCFALPKAKDVDERQMLKAMYGLVQKGLMQAEGHGFVLSAEIGTIVETIRCSTGYLLMESSDDEQPQRMIYLGKQAVILENQRDADQGFRLFSKEREDFWKWIEESADAPDFPVVSKDEVVKLLQMNELALQECRILKECSHPESSLGIHVWMENIQSSLGDVPCLGIRFIPHQDEGVYRDLLLCWGCANLWFVWCDRDKDSLSKGENFVNVMPDAAETRKEILALFWREAK